MSRIIRIVLVFLLLLSNAIADVLEIKVEEHLVSLPFWAANKAQHYGGVIIVKGGEYTAQSPVLISNFAEQLSRNGWSVVLLNCNNDATVPWVKQIPETISALREAGNKRIVLVHYGEQLNQSLEYFTKPQAKMINGLVMLSAYDEQDLNGLPGLRFPLFDIAGQFDYETVLNQMGQREKKFKQHNYVSVAMPGAHHDYQYSQELLLAFIHGWMTRLPEIEIQPQPILVSYIEPVYSAASLIAEIDESNWVGFIDDPVEPES